MLMTHAADNASKQTAAISVDTDNSITNAVSTTNEADGGGMGIIVVSGESKRNERDVSQYHMEDEKMLTIVKKIPVPIPITKV